jgi:ubiquinone biosynthesis protein UbiJ
MLELLSTASTALLEQAMNQALALDSSAQSKLAHLAGKNLLIAIERPEFQLQLMFTEVGVVIMNPQSENPEDGTAYDTRIQGKSFELLQLLAADNPATALFKSNIQIDGDQHFAQAVMGLFANLDIDWEYQLSRITGDLLAHQLGQSFRSSKRWLGDSHQSMMKNLEEFIHHELQTLPHRSEVDYYCQQVSHLRLQADRLEARLNRAIQQRNQAQASQSSFDATSKKGE